MFAKSAVVLLHTTAALAAQDSFSILATDHAPYDPVSLIRPAFVDIDGDGDADVLGARRITLNQAGDFLPLPLSFPAFNTPHGIHDFDGDGRGDVLGGMNGAYQELGVFLNRYPAGFLRVPLGLTQSSTLNAHAAIDLDGDGDLDLVINDRFSFRGMVVLLNDGRGVFTDRTATLAPPDTFTSDQLFGIDVEGDGDPDIVSTAVLGTGAIVFVNDGTGRLADGDPSRFPATMNRITGVFDVDGDGMSDVFTNTGELLLASSGSYVPAAVQPLPSDRFTSVVLLADVDGDGDADAWCERNSPGLSTFYENVGPGQPFADRSDRHPRVDRRVLNAQLPNVQLVDVDGDGRLDVAAAGQRIEVLLGQPGNRFVDLTPRRAAAPIYGDFDGDGLVDELLRREPFTLTFRKADGFGGFDERIASTQDGVVFIFATADFDGDGDLDAFVQPAAPINSASIYVNDGAGNFRQIRGSVPLSVSSVEVTHVADLDGDGDPDLVVTTRELNNSSDLFLLENQGNGVFTRPVAWQITGFLGQRPVTEVLDADGDGDVDLLVGVDDPALYRNDGSGVMTLDPLAVPARFPTAGVRPTEIASADIDGDGDIDFLVEYYSGRTNPNRPSEYAALFENDGTGNFSIRTVFDQGPRWLAADLVDVDDDGDVDFVQSVEDESTPQIFVATRILANDGRGTFTAVNTTIAYPGPPSGRYVDVDDDGDPDHVVGSVVVQNMRREVFVPRVPRLGGLLTVRVSNLESFRARSALLIVSAAPLATPVPVLDWGTLVADPAFGGVFLVSTRPSTQLPELVLPVPADPALGGAPLYLQALSWPVGASPRLSAGHRTVLAF